MAVCFEKMREGLQLLASPFQTLWDHPHPSGIPRNVLPNDTHGGIENVAQAVSKDAMLGMDFHQKVGNSKEGTSLRLPGQPGLVNFPNVRRFSE